MSKILIPLNNTPWGVVPHPQKAPSYDHILSFDNDDLKTQFIGKFLFNDKSFNYKTKINDPAFEKALIYETSTLASCMLDLDVINTNKQGLKYTQHDILNLDFIIVQEDNEFKFFTVTSVTKTNSPNQKTYTLSLDLDIFFTYDVKETLKGSTPVVVNNAHFDRFLSFDDGTKILPNLNPTNFNSSGEEFDSAISQNAFFPAKTDKIMYDYSQYFDESVKDKDGVNELLNNIKVLNVYSVKPLFGGTGGEAPDYDEVFRVNQTKTPFFAYEFMDLPNGITVKHSIDDGRTYEEIEIANSETFNDNFKDNTSILKLSVSSSGYSAFMNFIRDGEPSEQTGLIISSSGSGSCVLKIKSQIGGLRYIPNHAKFVGKKIENSVIYATNIVGGININDNKIFNAKFNLWSQLPYEQFRPNIEHKWNYKYETKLLTSTYSNISLCSISNNVFDLKREALINVNPTALTYNNKPLFIKTINMYQLDAWRQITKIVSNDKLEHYDKEYDFNNSNYSIYQQASNENKLYLDDRNNYFFPTESNAWQEFNTRNRSQLNNQLLTQVNQIDFAKANIATTFANPLNLLNPSAYVNTISNLKLSKLALQQTFAKIKDIKNTPNKIESNGGNLNGDATLSDLKTKIVYNELYPNLRKQVGTHFMKFGVNYNDTMHDFNYVINTRYYFNYIKVQSIFSNITKRLSPEIKIQFENTLTDGTTIWHVRDIETFKGIKNYEFDNVEMDLLGENNR